VGARIVGVRRRDAACLVACFVAACVVWLAIGSSPAAASAPNDLSLKATYDVHATIHWSAARLSVSSVATVTNTAGGKLSALTFNLITLKTGAAAITSVEVDGTPAQFSAKGQTVVVTLPAKLARGVDANVRIDYEARFNAASSGSHRSLFAKSQSIVAAYRWIPWLSKKQPFKAPNFGETWVTNVSPRVTVTLESDKSLKFATSGTKTGSGANGTTFVAHDVRDFNFSASPKYNVTTVNHAGLTVRFYSTSTLAAQIKKWTLKAIDRFQDKIGAYPYPQLNVAMTPGGSGMESPGMTWISTTEPGSNLAYLAVHEVAHQWFYGVVGNNQGKQPFLDEGVSDFLARDTLNSFRKSRCAEARLDKATYDYGSRCYNEVVYVQSSQYIKDYRDNVGGSRFWAGVHDFYTTYKFQVAGTRAFWDTLDRHTGFNSELHSARFPSLYR
jgi:hypothetical protein